MGTTDDFLAGDGWNTGVKALGFQPKGTAVYLNGQRFKGIGINHFNLFIRQLAAVGPAVDVAKDIRKIAQDYKLPFIRFAVGWYDRTTWLNNWYNNKTAFYTQLDAVVAAAEQNGIGLVMSLFWNLRSFTDICFNVYGALQAPSSLGSINSNAWKLVSEYVTEVVTRYKDSPAVYMWELGNELMGAHGPEYFSTWPLDGTAVDGGGTPLPNNSNFNWGLRPDGTNYVPSDKMSLTQWQTFTHNFTALIRSIDKSGRAIGSGNGIGNSFAVRVQTGNSITADTLALWNSDQSTVGRSWIDYKEDAFSVITNHVYPMRTDNSLFFLGDEKNQVQFTELCKNWAFAAKKPFMLLEFGASYRAGGPDETSTDFATEQANFEQMLTYVQANLDVAALWNYNGDLSSATEWMRWSLTDFRRQYQLDRIVQVNQLMRQSVGLT